MRRTTVMFICALFLIALAALARLVPHPANFAPVMAVTIFGGAILPRKLAVIIPVSVLMVSDLFLGFYPIMPIVWVCYVIVAMASAYTLRAGGMVRLMATVLMASIFFYLVTNAAVWWWSGMYVHSWTGLAHCYILALPFFRNSLLSDAFYTTLLFGLFAVSRRRVAMISQQEESVGRYVL